MYVIQVIARWHRDKLKALKAIGDPISLREKEQHALPRAVQAAQDFVKISHQAIGGWASTKPWLNTTEVDQLRAEVSFNAAITHQKFRLPILLSF